MCNKPANGYQYDDAFGNALGNSVVGAQINAEKRKQQLDAFDKHLTEVNNQQAQNLTNQGIGAIAGNTYKDAAEHAGRITWALGRNAAIDSQVADIEATSARSGARDKLVNNFYSTSQQAYAQTVSGINAGLAAGDAIRQRNAGLQPFIDQRYTLGNNQAGSEFAALNGGLGLDVRNSQDWDDAIAFENAAWADGRARAQVVDTAVDIVSEIPENGGFTFAYGATAGGNMGGSVDGAIGSFISVDFNRWEFTSGTYGSAEIGAHINLPVPGASYGAELSLYSSPNYREALDGSYHIEGGELSVGMMEVNAGFITSGTANGLQLTLSKELWSVDKILPNHSVYTHHGKGVIFNSSTLSFGDRQ